MSNRLISWYISNSIGHRKEFPFPGMTKSEWIRHIRVAMSWEVGGMP